MATKKVTKRLDHNAVYWVVLERKWLTWKAVALYATKERATEAAAVMNIYDQRNVKVERVELIG